MRHGLWVICCLAGAGCSTIAVPSLFNPGWGEEQRARAERFDPYPEPDVGPEMVGSRPRDYQKPASIPQRVQNRRSFARRFGGTAPLSRW